MQHNQSGSTETVTISGERFTVQYHRAVDISRSPSLDRDRTVSAFGADPIRINPIVSVRGGQRCNCYALDGFAPHLHGTHTETRQHILIDPRPVVDLVSEFRFIARLITVDPVPADTTHSLTQPGDSILTRASIEEKLRGDRWSPEMLIVRTPNFAGKKTMRYGGTNPPYPHHTLAAWCVERGIEHIVLDVPSADREEGELFFHRTFWGDPLDAAGQPIAELRTLVGPVRDHATITELAFIPSEVPDGWYLCFSIPLGVPGDAAPVRPIVAPLEAVR